MPTNKKKTQRNHGVVHVNVLYTTVNGGKVSYKTMFELPFSSGNACTNSGVFSSLVPLVN